MKSTGFIKNGKYFRKEPDVDALKDTQQSTYTHWSHDRQREEHRGDLLQPFNPDGSPNEDFIELYPEESKQYGFIPEEE